MITRVYVAPKGKDSRGKLCMKALLNLDLGGEVSNVSIFDSYLFSYEFSSEKISEGAKALVNPVLEKLHVGELPKMPKFTYAIEIGYLPGVTDNVGHTAKETVSDFLHLNPKEQLEIYTSKIYFVSGNIKLDDAKKIALSLHNPLIERSYIASYEEISRKRNLPEKIPEVVLKDRPDVISVSLEVEDEELIKIGKEGILGEEGVRRGPLALDLASMKVIQKYFRNLGRNPTDIELESLAQTWSEHCKHTIFANPIDKIKDGLYKTYIKGATNLIRKQKGKKDICVSVFHDNAGAISFDEEYLITHKVETHNSPSALDPYGGAITGIVGVNRDTIGFGLGAKPVANTYGFCLGEPTDERVLYRDRNLTQKMFSPKRIMEGVVKGVNHGGNTSGIPTLNGFLKFDDRYRGKPLVFAGTLGIIPRKINDKLSHEKAARNGDYIVVVGGRVGRDGIHGATFSSVVMDSGSPATAVQIGDPITQKKLSDAIVKEARAMDLYNSITDNGAGGISCSVAEMAKECGGAEVLLERVPLKYPKLQPWEIWISESQERMTLAVPKKKWELFNKLMKQRGVEASIIGEFTNSGKCVVSYNGEKIMDMDMEFLHNGLPKHKLKTGKVKKQNLEPVLLEKKSYTKDLEDLISVNNIGGFGFVSEQYDHEVQSSSVLKPQSGRGKINTDAQVFRPVLSSRKGAVVTSSLYPSYGDISSYHMAASAIDTSIRNIVAAGGKLEHIGILDNFCWCSSYDKGRLKELTESVKACYDYAVAYGTPYISGKDSMFNDFRGYDEKGNPIMVSIPPTLLISAVSVMPDISKTVSPEFKNPGDVIIVLGDTDEELGGSEYFKMQGHIGNNVPMVNAKKNIKTYKALQNIIESNKAESAISVTSGGLLTALAKTSIGGKLGASVSIDNLPGNAKSTQAILFGETQGRILISVNPKNVKEIKKMLRGVSHGVIGVVEKHEKFSVTFKNKKVVETNVKKLTEKYHQFSNLMK